MIRTVSENQFIVEQRELVKSLLLYSILRDLILRIIDHRSKSVSDCVLKIKNCELEIKIQSIGTKRIKVKVILTD